MANLKDDTTSVKREFESLSNATQIFIWSLVGLGVVIGVLIGGITAYAITVEEVDGRDCIEHEGELYCLEEEGGTAA